MLVLRLEIWPGGNRSARKTIGEVRIANRSNLQPISNYDLTFTPFNEAGEPLPLKHRHGQVAAHRRSDGAWPLVMSALRALGLGGT